MTTVYADHNVSHPAVAQLRTLGHDIVTARDVGLEYADDDKHLLLAAERRWILLTHSETITPGKRALPEPRSPFKRYRRAITLS